MSINARRKQCERAESRTLRRGSDWRKPVFLYSFAESGKKYLVATVTGPDTAKWRHSHPLMTDEQRRRIAADYWYRFRGWREART